MLEGTIQAKPAGPLFLAIRQEMLKKLVEIIAELGEVRWNGISCHRRTGRQSTGNEAISVLCSGNNSQAVADKRVRGPGIGGDINQSHNLVRKGRHRTHSIQELENNRSTYSFFRHALSTEFRGRSNLLSKEALNAVL